MSRLKTVAPPAETPAPEDRQSPVTNPDVKKMSAVGHYFKEGNQLWKQRKFTGRHMIFTSPEDLLQSCVAYFEWASENPIIETSYRSVDKELVEIETPKPRALNAAGLCAFVGIGQSTWIDYKRREGFDVVCEYIENIMYEQKFSNAAVNVMNPHLIARDLGLADKQEVKTETVIDTIEWTFPDEIEPDQLSGISPDNKK